MTAIVMDGKTVAQDVRRRVRLAVENLKADGIQPCLATVLVGDNAASATYVKNKHSACAQVGIDTRDHKMGAGTTQEELEGLIRDLNGDPAVHGILVQLPLPAHLDRLALISGLLPRKDVDGLTPHNAGLLASGRAPLVPCTPAGIMEMFDSYNVRTAGKGAVIINRSGLVGIPLSHLLLQGDATVTVCHSKTSDLPKRCRDADIIVTAVGDRTKFTLTGDMVRDGAVVVDVSIVRRDGRLCGDADYEEVAKKASHVSPVPGGVGPMTVAMLLKNTVTAASMASSLAGIGK